jgi:4-amino-4-deoxy-L-arabinose transferase-like glycosyltransferase
MNSSLTASRVAPLAPDPVAKLNLLPYLACALLFAVVYLGSAFSPSLQDDADSTHAEAAREMMVSGDYVTLHVNGVRYLEKAPMIYWLVALSFRMFGVNEFATRFPTVMAMFLLVLLASRWARQAFGYRAGVYAGLFVSTTAGYYLFTRIMIPEAILSLFISAAFYFFWSALDLSQQPWRWYAGYACLALAVLTKGLVALVFVGMTAVAYLLVTGDWRRWREFRIGAGLLLFLAIAAPWHILAGVRNPRFFWFYFVNEHFLRFVGKRYPVDYNKVPAALYWSLHLVWLFPWSLYLPLALRDLRRDARAARDIRAGMVTDAELAARTRILCWLWGGIVLVFFALSTSQEYYTFPAYFPFLLLLAGAVADEERSGGRRWLLGTAILLAAFSVIAGVVLSAGLWSSRHLPYVADISTVLARHSLESDTLSMSHFLDLTGESFAALRLPAALAALALLVGPAWAVWLRLRRRHFAATWITACTLALFLIAAHIALGRFDSLLSSRGLAAAIAQRAQPQDQVAIYGDQAFGSSLLFYLQRPVFLVSGRTTSMWFGSTYPDAPKIYWQDSDLVAAWSSPVRVFLFVPPHQKTAVESILGGNKFLVAENSGKLIYSNRP